VISAVVVVESLISSGGKSKGDNLNANPTPCSKFGHNAVSTPHVTTTARALSSAGGVNAWKVLPLASATDRAPRPAVA
jgi:hypothetical protein